MQNSTIRALVGAMSGMFITGVALADVVNLNDGRSFQGEIIHETDDGVVIDTMVSRIRTALTFSKTEIAGIERGALPDGFFSPPPAEPRVSERSKFDADDTLYIVVPIHGDLGTEVLAEGVGASLRYAERYGVGHVVFTIDSTCGTVDEASRIYQLLRKSQGRVQMHAVVRECHGAAIAVALWCDSLYVTPGATIGGSEDLQFDQNPDAAALQKQVVQSQVATEVANEVKRRGGGDGHIVLALLDPRQQYAAWTNDSGDLQEGYKPPAGIDPSSVVFAVGPDELLQLSFDQCVALGVPVLDGGVAALGKMLGATDWQPESDYGQTAMRTSQMGREKQAAQQQSRFEAQCKKNIQRREKTARYIETSIDQAKQWDPSEGEYATYGGVVNQRRGYLRVGGRSTPYYTSQSQSDWRYRSDTCIAYVEKARNGARSMQTLDAEAARLGLEPTYDKETLAQLLQEMNVHLDYLRRNRNRKGE